MAIGIVSVGYGMVDMAMIAPLGVGHLAAVGQGELITSGVLALLMGLRDSFSSRLAIAEGEGKTAIQLPLLFISFLLALFPCQIFAWLLTYGASPFLHFLKQDQALIPGITAFLDVRLLSIIPVLTFIVCRETLKICGYRNVATINTVFGLAINAGLNWVFLYSSYSKFFSSPEQAVALATLGAQMIMAAVAIFILAREFKARNALWETPKVSELINMSTSILKTGFGIGIRHFNDYVGSIIPMMFIGTLGANVLAAAHVATQLYTFFCRIPQSCFSTTFIFFGYTLGRNPDEVRETTFILFKYALITTLVGFILFMSSSQYLVELFKSPGLDKKLAIQLFWAYLLYMPFYFVEHFFGEILSVKQQGKLLFYASTIITYCLTLPLAYYSVFILDSAFFAIASKGVSCAILAFIFWWANKELHPNFLNRKFSHA